MKDIGLASLCYRFLNSQCVLGKFESMVFKWEHMSMYDLFWNNTPGAADKLDFFNWAGMITSFDAKCPIWNESKFDDYHMSCDIVCLFFINWKSLVVFVILNGPIKDIDWPNYVSLLTFDYGTINEKIWVDIFVMPSKGMSGHFVTSSSKKQ